MGFIEKKAQLSGPSCVKSAGLPCALRLRGAAFPLGRTFYLHQESYMKPPKLCCLTPGKRLETLESIDPAFPHYRSRNRAVAHAHRGNKGRMRPLLLKQNISPSSLDLKWETKI